MTAEHTQPEENKPLLERILETVCSIDRNVDEILDRMTDYIDGLEHDRSWRDQGYDLRRGCEYD